MARLFKGCKISFSNAAVVGFEFFKQALSGARQAST
jgi:hypothetical protein